MGRKIKDPGFGNNSAVTAGRMISKDGTFNVVRKNQSSKIFDAYHYLINLSWTLFFAWATLAFFIINLIFAFIYVVVGVQEINIKSAHFLQEISHSFFFSVQTFTSLGYGALAPKTLSSGAISSFEAFLGLIMFAFLTGLIYGRFSKPKASIRFSKHIIYRDFKETQAVMFRVVNNRASIMIKPRVTVTLALSYVNDNGETERNFFNLNLERNSITYLPTTWTIVHEIDKESPLFNKNIKELKTLKGEFLVMFTYYDESFNQEVHQMNSYTLEELLFNHKFKQAFSYNNKGQMVLDYSLFDDVVSNKS